MRLPRLTTRRLMVLVAVMAVLLEGALMYQRSAYCRKRATYCRHRAGAFRAIHAGRMQVYRFRIDPSGPVLGTTRESQKAWAEYYELLGRRYDQVARRPWLAIPLDPPAPEGSYDGRIPL
jgi:hypothetical protein